MINIIKSDLYRVLKGKAILISLVIIMLISLSSIFLLSAGSVGINVGNGEEFDSEYIEKVSKVKSLSEYRNIMMENGEFELDKSILGSNSILYYIFIVIIVILISTDFSNGTIKNSLSSTISRKRYYLSKLFLAMMLGTFIILFNNYFVYFFNLLINGSSFSSNILEITKITLYQLPLLYGVISLLIALSFICKRTAIFNSISIPFIMVFQLIGMMLINIFKTDGSIFYNYEFQYAMTNLANSPTISYILKCMALGLTYIIVFNIIGYISFNKAEIK